MTAPPSSAAASPWPLRWGWALAVVTFPLVWWGGFVSATGAGMAFRDWLTSDGTFMPLYPWLSSSGDKFVEHGHRLLGMAAGLLAIAVAASAAWSPRREVRWFAFALLAGVIAQGALGGLRVVWDARVVALVHGCTGPAYFAMTLAFLALLRPVDAARTKQDADVAFNLSRLAAVTAGLLYAQLVLGAIVRHAPEMTADAAAGMFEAAVAGHVVLGLASAAAVTRLAWRCWRQSVSARAGLALAGLALLQLGLGPASWVVKYGMPAWATNLVGETGHFNRALDLPSAIVRTTHGAVGALLFAGAVALAVFLAQRGRGFSHRQFAHASAPLPEARR